MLHVFFGLKKGNGKASGCFFQDIWIKSFWGPSEMMSTQSLDLFECFTWQPAHPESRKIVVFVFFAEAIRGGNYTPPPPMLSMAWRSKNKELDKKIIVYSTLYNCTRYLPSSTSTSVVVSTICPYFFGGNPRRKHPWKISHSQGQIPQKGPTSSINLASWASCFHQEFTGKKTPKMHKFSCDLGAEVIISFDAELPFELVWGTQRMSKNVTGTTGRDEGCDKKWLKLVEWWPCKGWFWRACDIHHTAFDVKDVWHLCSGDFR